MGLSCSGPSGGTFSYSWQRDNTSYITSLANDGTTTSISGTPVNNQNSVQTTNYTVNPTFSFTYSTLTTSGSTSSATTPVTGSCTGTAKTASVVVLPPVNGSVGTVTPNPVYSGNSATVALKTNVTSAGTMSYEWSRAGTAQGFSATMATGSDSPVTTTANGTSYAASITGTYTTSSSVEATYTITPKYTSSGTTCAGTSYTAKLTVLPVPAVSVTPSSTVVCSGENLTVAINDPQTGTYSAGTYEWSRTANDASVSGAPTNSGSITLASNETSKDIHTETYTNHTKTLQSVDYSATPTYAGGTIPAVTATVYVLPKFTATQGTITLSASTLCSGSNAAVTATVGSSGAGTIDYAWTVTLPSGVTSSATTSGTATGAGSGSSLTGIGTFNTGYLTNSSATAQTVTVRVVPTFKYGIGTCPGAEFTKELVVLPNTEPTVSPNSYTAVCSGAAINSQGSFTISTAEAATYTWTRTNVSGLTEVNPASTTTGTYTGTAATFSPPGSYTNSGTAPGTVTYTITAKYGATCAESTAKTVTVTVMPTSPATPSTTTETICSGDTGSEVTITTNTNAKSYVWTYTAPSGSFTPAALTSGTNSAISSRTYENTAGVAQTATYTVTPYYGANYTCPGSATTYTITVAPKAVPALTSPQTVCSGLSHTISITGTAASYTWKRDSDTPATIITPSFNTGTLTNTTASPLTVTYTVAAIYVVNGKECTSAETTTTITVLGTAKPSLAFTAQTVCSGTSPGNLNIEGSAASYQWTLSGDISANGTKVSTGATSTLDLTPDVYTNTGTVSVARTYTVTPLYGNATKNCPGMAETIVLTVLPKIPAGTAEPVDEVVCSGAEVRINVQSTVSGSDAYSYNWTRSNGVTGVGDMQSTSGALTATTAGVGAHVGSFTNPSNVPVVVSFTYTFKYEKGSAACTGTPIETTVKVLPAVTAAQTVTPPSVYSGNPATVTLGSNVASGSGGTLSYAWVRSGSDYSVDPATSSDNYTAAPGANTYIIGTYTYTGATTTPATATFNITPTYLYDGGAGSVVSCPGITTTATLTILPPSELKFDPKEIAIKSGSTQKIDLIDETVDSEKKYTWNRTTSSGSMEVTGSSSGSPTLNSSETVTHLPTETFTNKTQDLQAVTYTASSSYSGQQGSSASATIYVLPYINSGTATATAATICSGNSAQIKLETGTTPGSAGTLLYRWQVESNANVEGTNDTHENRGDGAAGSYTGSYTITTSALTNKTSTIQAVNIKVTPKFIYGGSTHTGQDFPVTTIYVLPAAAPATTSPANIEAC